MRILPPILVLGLLIMMAVLRGFWPGPLIPRPVTWLGLIPLLLGIGLLIAGSGRFRQVGTNIKTFDEPDVMVTDGPFRFSRNPMYLGFLLLLLGAAVLMGALTPLLGPALFALAAQLWYIPFEERTMHAKFGDTYRDYVRRVRRWF